MPEATHRLGDPTGSQRRPGELTGDHDGSALTVAVVCARFNGEITLRLLEGAYEGLDRLAVARERRLVAWVPGAFELPLAAKALAESGRYDAVVCLGAVIRGETSHYDFVAGECARGLQRVQLDTGIPVVFGVLTTENTDQALDRSGGKLGNKGDESVVTAVETANLLARLKGHTPA
ncbi:MAG: 6,7-dimethyl-8-ribityllumazine synthase [Acidimicrobiales bacterium]